MTKSTLVFLIGSLVSFFHTVPSLAGRTVSVPTLQIQKTGNYLGQYVTVYYGFEKTSIIQADTSAVSLSSVRLVQTRKVEGDNVQIPAVQIDKDGLRGAYDIVVVVISHYPNFSWKNADGSLPTGITDTKIYESSNTSYHKAIEIDDEVIKNPTAQFFSWPLNSSSVTKQ